MENQEGSVAAAQAAQPVDTNDGPIDPQASASAPSTDAGQAPPEPSEEEQRAQYLKREYVTLLSDSGLAILGYVAIAPEGGGGQYRDKYPGRAILFPVVPGFDHKQPRADLRRRLGAEQGSAWKGAVMLLDATAGRAALVEYNDEAELEMDAAEKAAKELEAATPTQ